MKSFLLQFGKQLQMIAIALVIGAAVTYAAGSGYTNPTGPASTTNAPQAVYSGTVSQVKAGSLVTRMFGAVRAGLPNPTNTYITFGANDGFSSYGDTWFQGGIYSLLGKTNLLGNVDIGPTGVTPVTVNLNGSLHATGHLTINTGNVPTGGTPNYALEVNHGNFKINDLPTTTGVGYTNKICADAQGVLGICQAVATPPKSVVLKASLTSGSFQYANIAGMTYQGFATPPPFTLYLHWQTTNMTQGTTTCTATSAELISGSGISVNNWSNGQVVPFSDGGGYAVSFNDLRPVHFGISCTESGTTVTSFVDVTPYISDSFYNNSSTDGVVYIATIPTGIYAQRVHFGSFVAAGGAGGSDFTKNQDGPDGGDAILKYQGVEVLHVTGGVGGRKANQDASIAALGGAHGTYIATMPAGFNVFTLGPGQDGSPSSLYQGGMRGIIASNIGSGNNGANGDSLNPLLGGGGGGGGSSVLVGFNNLAMTPIFSGGEVFQAIIDGWHQTPATAGDFTSPNNHFGQFVLTLKY